MFGLDVLIEKEMCLFNLLRPVAAVTATLMI